MITCLKFLRHNTICRSLTALGLVLALISLASSTLAQSPTPPAKDSNTTTTPPGDAEMMKQMMALGRPGENHKLLAGLAGSWTFVVKMWANPADPKAPPTESPGSAVRRETMDGRFFIADFMGVVPMPAADGKMKDYEFRGTSFEGYDNVKKKFVTSWIDNMGTGILNSEGTYDSATKTFTYTGDYEPMPGMKCKIRQVLKIVDADHHNLEWYEDRGAGETKTMEIKYARRKK
ncbi:MAG: hypothetical protein QOK24_2322 [Verrucomicrobiota bacterium]|jgi:hypothetical protein